MCRFLAYQGPALPIDDLLYKPDHSLIKQSYQAHELPEPLNGDGFGLGWYAPEVSSEPAVFTSIMPAWNNRNLRYMAPHLTSPSIFAHVRRASCGQVAQANCHPFHYGDLLMMHNGGVPHFGHIKRHLVQRLSDARYHWLDGQTDTQHLFALFLDHYFANERRDADAMADAFQGLFRDLAELKAEAGLTQAAHLNMVVTNGRESVGVRYVDEPDGTPLSLHYSAGSRYVCDTQGCRMRTAQSHEQSAALIASEPLTSEAPHWHDVPPHHFVLVNRAAELSLRRVEP